LPPVGAAASIGAMATPPAPAQRRSPWMWAAIGLAVVAIGLLVWGLSEKSDADDAQAKADKQQQTTAVAGTAAKDAYTDVTQDLNTTTEQLDDTEQQVQEAETAAEKSQTEADAAKQQAEQASSETEKAQAEADQAKAEADAATSKAKVATECAKAYISSIGSIFQGDDIRAQVAKIKEELKGISSDCSAAFEAS
jgi:chromosome segregation ATPase